MPETFLIQQIDAIGHVGMTPGLANAASMVLERLVNAPTAQDLNLAAAMAQGFTLAIDKGGEADWSSELQSIYQRARRWRGEQGFKEA